MKKNRLTALILTFVLLFGCLSVLPVFAEEAAEDGQVKIVAQNVVYSEKIQIAYAVDYDIDTAENDVKLAYTVDGETKLATYWGVENVKGTDYPVFVTEGFHANEFTKQVSAVAYTGEEAPADATPKLYSVGQYFYSMLYKQNFIDKTEADGTDFARKNLYISAIDFGTYAQDVLDKNDNTDPNTLLNQYCFLWAEDGVTINGDDAALVPAGTAVTLGGADTYNIGEATEITEYTAVAGVKALVTGNHTVVEPEPEEPPVEEEDTVTVTNYESGLPYSDYVATYDSNDARVENTSWPASNPSNSYASLDVDPKDAANHVLHVRVPANKTNIVTKVQLSNTVQTGNYYTFETKMYSYALSNGTVYANIQFINSADKASLDINVKALSVTDVANNALAICPNGSNYGGETDLFFDANDAIVKASEWFTLRVEYYYAGGDSVSGTDAIAAAQQGCVLKIYVNDALVYEGNEYWQVTKDIKYVQITTEATGVAKNVAYDDISFTRTDAAGN